MSRFIALLALGLVGIAVGCLGTRSAGEAAAGALVGETAAPLTELARSLAGASLVEIQSRPVHAPSGAATAARSDT